MFTWLAMLVKLGQKCWAKGWVKVWVKGWAKAWANVWVKIKVNLKVTVSNHVWGTSSRFSLFKIVRRFGTGGARS